RAGEHAPAGTPLLPKPAHRPSAGLVTLPQLGEEPKRKPRPWREPGLRGPVTDPTRSGIQASGSLTLPAAKGSIGRVRRAGPAPTQYLDESGLLAVAAQIRRLLYFCGFAGGICTRQIVAA